MIAEGSETLTLDGSIQLVKGVDYTIDYFSVQLNAKFIFESKNKKSKKVGFEVENVYLII